MLRHDEDPEGPMQSAAQRRVTPAELASAIACLEAKQEGDAGGTVSIGEAVSELGLAATPEAVWAEVEAARSAQSAAGKSWTLRRRGRALLSGVGMGLLALMGGLVLRPHIHREASRAAILRPAAMLDGIHNGQQFYVDTEGLNQIIDGEPASQVHVYPTSQGIRWGLIKHGGKTYVQAYTIKATKTEMMSKPFAIANTEEHFGATTSGFVFQGDLTETSRVTLPVGEFHRDESLEGPKCAVLLISGVQTDGHLWDAFEDRFD